MSISRKTGKRWYSETSPGLNHHKKWEPFEDQCLLTQHTDKDLAKALGRSVSAIQSRRQRLKLRKPRATIQPSPAVSTSDLPDYKRLVSGVLDDAPTKGA